MARSYEFPREIRNKTAMLSAAEGVATSQKFQFRCFPDRAVLGNGTTEYIITSWNISETGLPHPMYVALKSAVRPLIGAANG